MAKQVVLFTDPPWARDEHGRLDESRATVEREVLGDDYELRFAPCGERVYRHDGAEFARDLTRADALVICRYQIGMRTLELAPKLRVVCRQGVGFDNLSEDLLRERGLIGFNIPDYCTDEVAAHTVALVLALERRLLPQHNALAGGTFDVYAGGVPRRLQRATAGIIGFGRIGRAVAARLRMFYREVYACDPYVAGDLMEAHGVCKLALTELLLRSDVVLLHPSLTAETKHLIDASAIELMKPDALLINAARGALIEPRALWHALSAGRLGGAGLDVFSPEDPKDDPWYAQIVRLPNVVVTSHRAFLSEEAELSQRSRAVEGVKRVLEHGLPPAEGHRTAGVVYRWASSGGA